jgi:putative oxidoreductase
MDLGLFVIRLAVGLTVAAHGCQKLFGWFGGGGPAGTASMFESLGLRPGRPYALLAGLAEAAGGLLLALGFLTPLAVAAIIGVMLVAFALVHRRKGFFLQGGGYEYNLVLAGASLGLAFTGPGAFSLDAVLGLTWGDAWAVAALIAGLLAGTAALLFARAVHRVDVPRETPHVPG